jgi:phage terminase small subunit
VTPKQEAFVREYLIDLNATQAAIRAGYSARTAGQMGDENLKKPEIAKSIQSAMDERAARTEITADYVLQTIVDTVERCKQARPVLDRKGEPILVEIGDGTVAPAYTFDSTAVLKGAELLGRHLKLFTDKVEHSGEIDFANADERTARLATLKAERERLSSIH